MPASSQISLPGSVVAPPKKLLELDLMVLFNLDSVFHSAPFVTEYGIVKFAVVFKGFL